MRPRWKRVSQILAEFIRSRGEAAEAIGSFEGPAQGNPERAADYHAAIALLQTNRRSGYGRTEP